MGSIRLADARTWPHHQQGLPSDGEPGERDIFLAEDFDDEEDKEAELEGRQRVMGNTGAQLSRVDVSNGVIDVPNERYGLIPGEHAIDGMRSDRVVPSTLSSKAGIVLVSLLLLLVWVIDDLYFNRAYTTSSSSFPNSSSPDLRLYYLL